MNKKNITENKKTTKKNYTELVYDVKHNKKNDVYRVNSANVLAVFTSKKNAIIYVHDIANMFVNAQHKSTIKSVLEKYNATRNKNYSERDRYEHRVCVSVDTFDTFLNDFKRACAYAVSAQSEEKSTDAKKSAQRTKKSTESAQSVTESTETENNTERTTQTHRA